VHELRSSPNANDIFERINTVKIYFFMVISIGIFAIVNYFAIN
jgi:hypothetical protein